MTTEETKILNPSNEEERTEKKTAETAENKSQATAAGSKAAYAAGGFAAGAAAGSAASTYAATAGTAAPQEAAQPAEETTGETVTAEQDSSATEETAASASATEEVQEAPQPEDVLLATDEGVRVAQVNDDASFSEAFADARAQVGAGGVFEWRGHVYGTYYEEEWDNMTPEQRAQYQSKIDYGTIAGDNMNTGTDNATPTSASSNTYTHASSTHATQQQGEAIAPNTEMVAEPVDSDIKVLGVETVEDETGRSRIMAGIEVEGHQGLLVDVDNDQVMDVIAVDLNNDGQITSDEMADISDANITASDLQQHIAANQNPQGLLACNDGMPDYVNDADISSLA